MVEAPEVEGLDAAEHNAWRQQEKAEESGGRTRGVSTAGRTSTSSAQDASGTRSPAGRCEPAVQKFSRAICRVILIRASLSFRECLQRYFFCTTAPLMNSRWFG